MQSGDGCPKCKERLQVVNTIPGVNYRRRYIGCRHCGYRPDQAPIIVPIQFAPARNKVIATGSK